MKKLLFMLMGIAATINVTAATYTAKATLLLESQTSHLTCEIDLAQSNSYGALDGYDMYMPGRKVALYPICGERQLQIATAADFTNVALGLKTDASTSYTITVSGVEGSETLVLFDLADMNDIKQYPLVNEAVINITAPANSTIEDRFIINYVPAPTCTTVRNNLVVDRYYTICLPKAVTAANGASFWSMSNRGEGVAYLEEVQLPLVAGRPYIFQAEDDELCVELSGDDAAAGAAGALVGTFTPMDQDALSTAATAASSDLYLLYNNELRPAAGSGNNLPAYRAYIVYNQLIPANPTPAPGRRVRAIPMQGQTATGVENLNASEAPAKAIIDGKLYIIRGEQMFDATGRLVK